MKVSVTLGLLLKMMKIELMESGTWLFMEKIIADNTVLDIDVKPITLVFNKDHLNIRYPDRFIISCFETLKYLEEIDEVNKYSACLFKIVVPFFKDKVDKQTLLSSGNGYRHLIGLIGLTLNFIKEDKKFVWSYPESYLHPSLQGNLADLQIIITQQKLFSKFIQCVNDGKFDTYIEKDGGNLNEYFFNVVCNQYLKTFTNS